MYKGHWNEGVVLNRLFFKVRTLENRAFVHRPEWELVMQISVEVLSRQRKWPFQKHLGRDLSGIFRKMEIEQSVWNSELATEQ